MDPTLDDRQDQLRRRIREWLRAGQADASELQAAIAGEREDLDLASTDLVDQAILCEECGAAGVGADLIRGRAASAHDRIRCGAYLVGLARRAIDLGFERAHRRLLGGRPLIEHQALAHRLARAVLALESARMEVWNAAWRRDTGEDVAALSAVGLAAAAEAATLASRELVQVSGAKGTAAGVESDLYRSAHELAAEWGPPGALWKEAARLLGSEGEL